MSDAKRWRRGCLAAVAVFATAVGAAAIGTAPATAAPARYVLLKCDPALPGGGTEGATFHGQPPFTGADNCNEPGGSIFVVQQGEASSAAGYWSLPLPAPPGGSTESVTVTGSMCNGAHADAGTVAFAVQRGWSLSCNTETHTFPVDSSAGSAGLVWVGCEGQCLGNPESWAGDFAATEVDPVAPSVNGLGGTLLAGGVLHGHQTVTAAASDEGGGVASLALRINGLPVEPTHPFPCQTIKVNNSSVVGTVATKVTPCPANAEAGWSVDTDAYPFQKGENTVEVCAQDFSTIGAANEGCTTQAIKVDDSCAESPVAGGEDLSAAFKHSARQRITVGYGHSARLAGRLLDADGRPVAGATVCIETRTLVGATPKVLVQLLTTDAQGHYSYQLEPGPNRAVIVAYRRDARQVERHLRYYAHSYPSLHASARQLRNGQWIHFRGRLPGPRRRGRIVILQANVLGAGRWITFRKATSDRKGVFRAGYHFSATTRTTAYRFRAVVPTQSGYPWVQGHSKPIEVLVRR